MAYHKRALSGGGHGGGGGGHGGGGHGGGGHGGGGHHGGGHHGGGHGHRGGRGRGGGWYGTGPGWGWGPAYYDTWAYPEIIEVVDSTNSDQVQRAMEYILGLPKSQQKAAYQKLFPNKPVPTGIGDFASTLSSPVVLVGAAVAAWFLFLRKKKG